MRIFQTEYKKLTSPNNWNLAFSPRSTPAIVEPEFNPIRRARFVVPFLQNKCYNQCPIKQKRNIGSQ